MTRAFKALVFAAVLALLAAQGVSLSAQMDKRTQVAQCAEFRQQISQEKAPANVRGREPVRAGDYVSPARLQPHLTDLFQRPPPEDSPVLS